MKKKKAKIETGKKAPARTPNKAEKTRRKILEAARAIFARYPYHTASMRMIGKEGKFEHALIRYYYPTKASLFEAVLTEMRQELLAQKTTSFDSLSTSMSVRDALAANIRYFIEYYFKNPTAIRIIVLNAAFLEKPESLPGFQIIIEILSDTRMLLKEKNIITASTPESLRFLFSYISLLYCFLGFNTGFSWILRMKESDEGYKQWIQDTMVYIFLPTLEKLVEQSGSKFSPGTSVTGPSDPGDPKE